MRISLGSARQWHWISAAVCLAGMFMFAITGITLNHAADIFVEPQKHEVESLIPETLLPSLQSNDSEWLAMPRTVNQWLGEEYGIQVPSDVKGEFDGIEYYFAWPGPGKDSWLSVDVETGDFIYESTDRGWIAYFNDLHKGRNTGTVWAWFIDIFAAAVIIFSVTGLQLLLKQAPHKKSTWPITALGVLAPVVIMLLFIH